MTDTPLSDDARADRAWSSAAVSGIVRHIAPGFWPIAVSLVLSAGTWVLAPFGAARLGGWAWLVAAYFAAVLAGETRVLIKVRGVLNARRAAEPNPHERLRADYHTMRAAPRGKPFNKMMFWRILATITIPKAVLAGYALLAWWPLPAAATVAAVTVGWAFVSRLIHNERVAPAMSMMLTPRGPEGLPTPEI